MTKPRAAALVLVTALLGPLALAQTFRGASPKVGSGYLPSGASGEDVLSSLVDDLFVGPGWGPQERREPRPRAKASATPAPASQPTASAAPSAPPSEAPEPPPPPAPPPLSGATEYLSPAMMGIGYTLAGLGAGALVVGGLIYASAPQTYTNCMGAPCSGSPPDATRRFNGTVTMIAGAIGVGIGLPIGIIGSVRVQAEAQPKKASAALQVGPTGATLVGSW